MANASLNDNIEMSLVNPSVISNVSRAKLVLMKSFVDQNFDFWIFDKASDFRGPIFVAPFNLELIEQPSNCCLSIESMVPTSFVPPRFEF